MTLTEELRRRFVTQLSRRLHERGAYGRYIRAMPLVLIVEDERDLAQLIEFNLQQAGIETQVAHTGERALTLARARTPDLVLLDLMLPDVHGTEVCRELKA